MKEKNCVKLVTVASLENLSLIRAMLKTYFEFNKISEKLVVQLLSVVDELSTNVVEHGYGYEEGKLTIEAKCLDGKIYLSVEDEGLGFDETKSSKDDGGIGLVLTKSIVDSFKIEKKAKGTVLKIEKKI